MDGTGRGATRAGVNDGRQGGLTRRDALRRAAVIGGAVAYTAPAVQRLGMLSAHAVSPPPPPPPPPPPSTFTGVSYVGLVFTCDGQQYRAKWEEGGGWGDADGSNLPGCPAPGGWSSAPAYPSPAAIGVSTNYVDGELFSVTFTLPGAPGTCHFESGAGVAKGGNPGNEQSGGFCVSGAVDPTDDRRITFTAPTA